MFNSLKIFWLNFSNFEGGRKFSNTEMENKQNVHYSSIHPNSTESASHRVFIFAFGSGRRRRPA